MSDKKQAKQAPEKKLQLKKEAIRDLPDADLQKVVGGLGPCSRSIDA